MNIFQLFSSNGQYKTNFEHVQYAITHQLEYCIITTLPIYEQNCLISKTVHAGQEESLINDMVHDLNTPDKKIIIYGKHSNDKTPEIKYQQFVDMGITDVYVYTGGLFEWLILQDIYGIVEFPTTENVLDILKYKPPKIY